MKPDHVHHNQKMRYMSEAYESYADDLFRFCLVKTRNRDQALDIVQETFLKTWNYLKDNDIDEIRAFLYRVARNSIIDGSRKKKTDSLEALIDEHAFEVKDNTPLFTEALSARQAFELLESWDSEYRELLIMKYIEGLTLDEMADITSISKETLSVQLHRAQKYAREYLEKNYGKIF
jgi:RNA polymerase sigma-70 factor, ECF subfamily